MTPDNYVKTMKRLITMDQTALFAMALDQRDKITALNDAEQPLSDAERRKERDIGEVIDCIETVMVGKFGIHISFSF